jgi:1,4-dihydroxy-2-naphthoate octaprenyltransferase
MNIRIINIYRRTVNVDKCINLIKVLDFALLISPLLIIASLADYMMAFSLVEFIILFFGLLLFHASGFLLKLYSFNRKDAYEPVNVSVFRRIMYDSFNLKQKMILNLIVITSVLAFCACVFFVYKSGYPTLIFALTAIVFTVFFNNIVKAGYGEFVVFLAYGPLTTLGGYYAITQRIDMLPIVAAIPIGLFAAAIELMKNTHFVMVDSRDRLIVPYIRIKNLAIIVGAGFFMLALNSALGYMPYWTLLGLIPLPLAILFINILRTIDEALNPLYLSIIILYIILLTVGAFIALGYWLDLLLA